MGDPTKEDLTCPFHSDLEREMINQRKWRFWFMLILIVNTFLSGGNLLGKIFPPIAVAGF